MSLFKKKTPKEDTEEYKQAKKSLEDNTKETVQIQNTPPETPKEASTEEIIAQNTELWYKARVLEMVAETLERIRKETLSESDK